MKSKNVQHIVGLIVKKCVELKIEKGIDAFFNYHPHCNLVEIEVYKNWSEDSSKPFYTANFYTDGFLNFKENSKTISETLDHLNSIYLGLGVE